MNDMTLEPWQWPEARWRSLVNQVRAGRPFRPSAWKNGARCAVALSFDADHETNELRDGGKSIGRMAWGQYGNRVGVPRILKLLERHGIKATFYVPAVAALLYEDEQRRVVAEGHEIGIHSWIHEANTQLPPGVERDLTFRATDVLERLAGRRPVGIRTASWDFSTATVGIIREMGLLYDSSLMADDDPYELLDGDQPTGIVELPVEWILDDAPLFDPRGQSYMNPRDLARVWIDEFDKAYDEGTMFVLTMHPHVIGHRSRMVALEQVIDHVRSKPAGTVWWATHSAAAEYVRKQGLLGEPRPHSPRSR